MINTRIATHNDLAFLNTLPKTQNDYYSRCLESLTRDVFIALYGEQCAGACTLNWESRYSRFHKSGVPEIEDLFVLEEYRHKGIARALLELCEKTAIQKQCTEIGIAVALGEQSGPAQRLYVVSGYVPDGLGVSFDRNSIDLARAYLITDSLCLMLSKKLEKG